MSVAVPANHLLFVPLISAIIFLEEFDWSNTKIFSCFGSFVSVFQTCMNLGHLHKLVHMGLHFVWRHAIARNKGNSAGVNTINKLNTLDSMLKLAIALNVNWEDPEDISHFHIIFTDGMSTAGATISVTVKANCL